MTTQTFWIGTRETGIDPAVLDQEQYFQAFFQEVCRKKLLGEEDILRIQTELLELLKMEAVRYTNDESSSLPVETAQALLQSVTYCIGSYFKTLPDVGMQLKLLKEQKVSDLFLSGGKAVEQRRDTAKQLLQRLTEGLIRIDNIAYRDSILEGLPKFFHDYDTEFGTHEAPADIDYPSFVIVNDLLGVEYMEEYLRRLCLENDFLNCFSAAVLSQLLKAYDRDASHMLINLFELTLINVLGCRLLEKDIRTLDIPAAELVWLQEKMSKLSKEARLEQLKQAFLEIAEELEQSEELITYVIPELEQLAGRLSYHLDTYTLSHFFLSFRNGWQETYEYLEEGEIMEDYKLRMLMERIDATAAIRDKVALIREEVRSTTDFIELLEECFYEEDYAELFQNLGEAELQTLEKRLLYDAGGIPQEDFEPQPGWQQSLWNYLNLCPGR